MHSEIQSRLPKGEGTVTASAAFHPNIQLQCSFHIHYVVVERAELKPVDTQ